MTCFSSSHTVFYHFYHYSLSSNNKANMQQPHRQKYANLNLLELKTFQMEAR